MVTDSGKRAWEPCQDSDRPLESRMLTARQGAMLWKEALPVLLNFTAGRGIPLSILGAKIRGLRQYRGLTQSELAGEACTRQYIARIESGKSVPSAELMAVICAKLECPLSELAEAYAESQADRRETCRLAVLMCQEGKLRDAYGLVNRFARPQMQKHDLLYLWGEMLDAAGHPRAALVLYRQALDKLDDIPAVECLYRMGKCTTSLGQHVEAHRIYTAALSRLDNRRLSATDLKIKILINLANVEFVLSATTSALAHFSEGLALARVHSNLELQLLALLGVSACQLELAHHKTALQLLSDCEALCQAIGRSDLLPKVYNNKAIALQGLGDTQAAVALLNKSVQLKKNMGLVGDMIYSLNELTRIHWASGNVEDARACNVEALRILETVRNPKERALALELAARIAERDGLYGRALSLVSDALSSLGDISSAMNGRLICLAGELHLRLGHKHEAMTCFRRVSRLLDSIGKEGSEP